MEEYCSKPKWGVLSVIIITVLAIFTLSGCGGGGGGSSSGTGTTGTLRGVIYESDGVTPVAGATVYVPVSGRAVTSEEAITSTVTASDGSFLLTNVPAGDIVLKVEKDSWAQTIEVTAVASETVVLPKETTTLLDTAPGSPFDNTSDDEDLDQPPSSPFRDSDDVSDTPPSCPFADGGDDDTPPPPPFEKG